MRRIEITADAKSDLDAIYLDGLTRFGLHQADHFQDQIAASFRLLAEQSEIGVDLGRIRSGYRGFYRPNPCKIIYRYDEDTLFILRVYHGRQDHEVLLSE